MRELDVSNDPEIERLGANATALYALEFWEKLCVAARRDGRELDPIWQGIHQNDDHDDDDHDDAEDEDTTTVAPATTSIIATATSTTRKDAAYHTKQIVLTTSLEADVRLYKRFRSNFGYFPVGNLKSSSSSSSSSSSTTTHNHDNHHDHYDSDLDLDPRHSSSLSSTMSPLGGERWTSLLLASEGVVEDFNFMTLLREDVLDMFWMTEEDVCDGVLVVPRAQFIFVEVARIQEGWYGNDFRKVLQLWDVKTQSDILQECHTTMRRILWNTRKQTQNDHDDGNHDHGNDGNDSEHDNNTNNNKDDEVKEEVSLLLLREQQQRALQALALLQTQWPHPPISILKQAGVIPILKRVMATAAATAVSLSSTSSSTLTRTSTSTTTSSSTKLVATKLHESARSLLQYWQDLHELGRISKQWLPTSSSSSSSQQQQQYDDDDQKNGNNHGQSNDNDTHKRQQQHRRMLMALQRAGQALVSSRVQQLTTTSHGQRDLPAIGTSSIIQKPFGSFTPTTTTTSSSATTAPMSTTTVAAPFITTKTTNLLDDVTLDVTNLTPSPSPQVQSDSRRIFSEYGMLVLEHLVSSDILHQCQLQAQRAMQELIVEQLQPRGLQVDGDNAFDYPFVRQRPGHRVDNRYHILDDVMSPMARLGQWLLQILPEVLFVASNNNSSSDEEEEHTNTNNNNSKDDTDHALNGNKKGYKILYGGVVHSFPRKDASEPFPPAQIWHRDGPSLFSNGHPHHETHCFNVFIPLVDVTTENGTTEFIPGTHSDAVFEDLATQVIPLAQRDPSAQHEQAVRAFCKAGTVIAFDIRLLHRGLSNTSNQDRPVLYFTIAKDWFLEAHMFQQPSDPATMIIPPSPVVVGPSHRQLVQGLYRMITGQRPFSESLLQRRRCSRHLQPTDRLESAAYGHPHYTMRFDLLLLELFQSNESNPIALQNLQAILAFSSATVGDREAMTREFIYSFGEVAVQRKLKVLEEARLSRRQRSSSLTLAREDSLSSSATTLAINANETTFDFSTIEQDMSDVFALYKLTAAILMEESVLLSKLGFTADEQGVCILLALLKANAKHSVLTTNCGIGVSIEQVEETFTSWWHAGEGRFAFWQTDSEEDDNHDFSTTSLRPKKLLVVFSSLGSGIARPEWCGSLRKVARELSSTLDILHVMDPAFSWYCQDPSCQWQGGEYYLSQLSDYVRDYESVMYLGDSMGAAAALRFSELANVVLAFTPQDDISHYEAITRLDFKKDVKDDFQRKVVEAVTKTSAVINIHYGNKCEEDIRQVQLLPKQSHIRLIAHDFDDHILSLHLRDKGQLKGLIEDAVRNFVNN